MTSFQRCSHDANVPRTVESVITSSICNVDKIFLDGFLEFGGVDEICCAEFLCPFFFAIVGVYGDDFGGAIGDTALDYAQTNATSSKDGTGGAFFDFGGSSCGAVTSSNTTAEETGFVERCLGVDGNNRDVSHDYKSEKPEK